MVYKLQTGVQRAKRKVSIGIVSAVTMAFPLALALSSGGAQAEAPCNVPSASYPTIQSAVNDPTCSVVNVAPGAYNENVTIPRSVTLNGAQAGVDARTRSSASESVINGGAGPDITVNADNVTIDGFTLNGPAGSGALVMLGGNNGETIKNNIINNASAAAYFDTSSTVFNQNAINSTTTATEGFQASTIPAHDVTVSDNNFSGANPAIYNADVTIIEGNSNVTISGNTSNGDGTLVALFKTNGAQITNNTVTGGGGASAIYIGGADSNVSVTGNQVTAAGAAVKVANAFGDGVNSAVSISKNMLHANEYGVFVTAPAVATASTVTAHQNSLTANTTLGISNEATGTLSGTCNWWGAANGPGPVGPGSGDKVSTGIAYTPWLVSANPNGACIGGNIATSKDQCKNDGWMTLTRTDGSTFKNQGACVSYTNMGR